MTNHDVTVATPSDDSSGERPNVACPSSNI